MSASTPSSTGRPGPPRRQMTAMGARADSPSLQTAVKVRWLMSHHSLLLEEETACGFVVISLRFALVRSTGC